MVKFPGSLWNREQFLSRISKPALPLITTPAEASTSHGFFCQLWFARGTSREIREVKISAFPRVSSEILKLSTSHEQYSTAVVNINQFDDDERMRDLILWEELNETEDSFQSALPQISIHLGASSFASAGFSASSNFHLRISNDPISSWKLSLLPSVHVE